MFLVALSSRARKLRGELGSSIGDGEGSIELHVAGDFEVFADAAEAGTPVALGSGQIMPKSVPRQDGQQ